MNRIFNLLPTVVVASGIAGWAMAQVNIRQREKQVAERAQVEMQSARQESERIARRLTDLASAAGFSLSFTPSPVDVVAADSKSLVAITSHVANPEVLESFTSRGIRFVVLPDTVRGGFGAEGALSAIVNFVAEDSDSAGSIVEPHLRKGIN
jgi:hypothetical protein